MAADHHYFMGLCLAESKKAFDEGNVPVGSVIVRDGKVVGVGRNNVASATDPTGHAEIVAIRDACRNLGTVDLSGCTCYTGMEPCPMCCWAIRATNIGQLVMGARHADMRRPDYGDYSVERLLAMTKQSLDIVTGVRVAECEAMRRSWPGHVELPP
jgi:tRNA(Arg) A34 adenosine deaminase TadA